MKLPYINPPTIFRETITLFKGLNKTPTIGQGEFSTMANLSSINYPLLSPREKRRKLTTLSNPQGLIGKDSLIWINDNRLYHAGALVARLDNAHDGKERSLVGMGAYVIIYPDEKLLNTADPNPHTNLISINHTFTLPLGQRITYTLSDKEGTPYDYIKSPLEPDSPAPGDYWLDTGATTPSLKVYSSYTQDWVNVLTTYVKISASGIGAGFKVNDGVMISGSVLETLNMNDDGTGYVILQGQDDDYIVVIGIMKGELIQTTPLKIERKAPDMDFVIEANNRLWGCKASTNEIYASKLGDPTNWRVYEGLSTDSYAATIESDGSFTGIFNYLGNVLFFKENHMHKALSYSWPPQISSMPVSGVQKGSEKSLALVGQSLMYKSIDGVMVYTGAFPVPVSQALGNKHYSNAVAGAVGYTYYISMKDEGTNTWHMFTYDAKTDLWHRQDSTQVKHFARCLSDLFYIGSDNVLYAVTRNAKALAFTEGTDEAAFSWYGETGDMLILMPDNKFISKIQLKMEIEEGASAKILFKYDSADTWEERFSYESKSKKKAFTLPIIPRRCDHFKIRIEGKGNVKVFALSKYLEQGSELL